MTTEQRIHRYQKTIDAAEEMERDLSSVGRSILIIPEINGQYISVIPTRHRVKINLSVTLYPHEDVYDGKLQYVRFLRKLANKIEETL